MMGSSGLELKEFGTKWLNFLVVKQAPADEKVGFGSKMSPQQDILLISGFPT